MVKIVLEHMLRPKKVFWISESVNKRSGRVRKCEMFVYTLFLHYVQQVSTNKMVKMEAYF